ncbi:MAG: hypothetical protein ACR2M8_13050 [Pyrinomonadaceae bacterium]|nr:hypothetical protein [Acidobacteriota bacterium]MDQ3490796.1 hypothetical protein [Acidobacteriota bacterium]
MNQLKDLILWKYDRETSQYLIFCLLIVAFIFLTPNTWFEKREQLTTQTSRLIVQSSDFTPDQNEWEKRVKELSGRPDAEIIAMRKKTNSRGETFYEVDFR